MFKYQGWAKSDSKLQALCPDLDHQAFQAFWGNSRKLIEKGKTNILSRLKLYTYGDHVCTLIKIMLPENLIHITQLWKSPIVIM